ncbi:hypothetical protein [Bacillus testis]|uniref:hypothetical protein n=1 Tax=Bacillus testis TaxID=1622072 RepID=UPI00067EE14A|nr:hypothetical protein [Bacillus testis]
MDKLERRNTITITLNEDIKPKKQGKSAKAPDRQEAAEQKPVQPVEEMQETPADAGEIEFDWKLPAEEPALNKQQNSIFSENVKQKKVFRKGRGIQHLFVIVTIAVLIGSGFTYIALKTITSKDPSSKEASALLENQAETVPAPAAGETVAVSPLKISMVQGGVFSNKEAAEKGKQLFHSKGMPAIVFVQQEKYYVLLFAGDNLARTKRIAQEYRNKGIDSYWKEFSLETAKGRKVTPAEAKELEAVRTLYRELATSSSAHMLAAKENHDASIQHAVKQLKQATGDDKGIQKVAGPLLKAAEVNGSGESVKTALETQEQLLNFLLAYQDYIK